MTFLVQRIESGAKKLLSDIGVSIESFNPDAVVEIPLKADNLLVDIPTVKLGSTHNPFVAAGKDEYIILAVVLTHRGKVFVEDFLHNGDLNVNIEFISPVVFGISSLFGHIPTTLVYKKVTDVHVTDCVLYQKMDDDDRVIRMPIIVVEVADIVGVEEYFIKLPATAKGQTAKLQKAIRTIDVFQRDWSKSNGIDL